MTDPCVIDLRLGTPQPMVLNLSADPIQLSLDGSPIELELGGSSIDLELSGTSIDLQLASTGPQGPPGDEAAAVETIEAGETISALKPIVILDGQAFVASSADLSHRGFTAGISITSATLGNNVRVQTFGLVQDNSWSWDVSKPLVFVGVGVLTQTPPDISSQPIARVQSSDTLFVDIWPVIERN